MIFIWLGYFHTEMTFFSAIGKVNFKESPYMLSECNVLAKGSLRPFLSGKHYNRCKRPHEILSLSMEVLHVKFFMNSLNDDQIAICKNIKDLNQCNEKEKQDADAVINLYNLFTEQSETTRCT